MNKMPGSEKAIRFSLGALLMLVALNAFGGGYYAIAGAPNVPVEWLEDSPFRNYFIPGLFLFIIVGGVAIFSGILVFQNHIWARKAAFFCGILILLWLAIQVSIIGYVSWMQPATTIAALIILLLTWKLPKYEP